MQTKIINRKQAKLIKLLLSLDIEYEDLLCVREVKTLKTEIESLKQTNKELEAKITRIISNQERKVEEKTKYNELKKAFTHDKIEEVK